MGSVSFGGVDVVFVPIPDLTKFRRVLSGEPSSLINSVRKMVAVPTD